MSNQSTFYNWLDQESNNMLNSSKVNFNDSIDTNSKPPTSSNTVPDNTALFNSYSPNDKPNTPQYSMEEMLQIYNNLVTNNQLIPSNSNEAFKSSTLTSTLTADLINNSSKSQESRSQSMNSSVQINSDSLLSSVNDLSIDLKKFALDESQKQKQFGAGSPGSTNATMGNPSTVNSSAGTPQPQFVNPLLQSINRTGASTPASIPPGLCVPNAQSTLLSPKQIKWYYMDASYAQQGPFDGEMMQSWYSLGYLKPDLSIRRDGETSYRTLSELIQIVGDAQFPFSIPLPSLNVPPPLSSPAFGANSAQMLPANSFQSFSSTASIFGGSTMSTTNSHLFGNNTFGSNVGTGTTGSVSTAGALGGSSSQNRNWFNSNGVSTPTGSEFLSYSQSPFLPSQDTSNELPLQSDLDMFGTSVISPQPHLAVKQQTITVTGNSSKAKSPQLAANDPSHSGESDKITAANQAKIEMDNKRKEAELIKLEKVKQKYVEEAKELEKHIKNLEANKKASEETKEGQTELVEAEDMKKNIDSTKPTKPVFAPWAAVTQTVNKPTKSLDEIQKEEVIKRNKDLELKRKLEEQDRLLASRLALEESTPYIKESPSSGIKKNTSSNGVKLPTTSTWATNGSPVVKQSIKTLDEIQKEETRLAKARAEAEAVTQQQKTIAAAIAVQKKSFASSIAESNASSGDNAWTIVSNKKLRPTPTSSISNNAIGQKLKAGASLSPTALRSVSTPTIPTVNSAVKAPLKAQNAPSNSTSSWTAVAPSTGELSIAKEFLVWCRGQLAGLYPTVNKEDVLSIMLQLPSGYETQEIIADTIYSNSSTMDGRRFASEFTKRRGKVEQYVVKQGYDFNWQEVLNSGGDQSDEWDVAFTKVTSKKNKRKN